VAALILEWQDRSGRDGRASNPAVVADVLATSVEDHARSAGGVEVYTDEGRTPDFNVVCEGMTDGNGPYGEGIIDEVAAVQDQ
jgi:lantibiotic leader peptide-processing serine protease